jgi:hypothetical protein
VRSSELWSVLAAPFAGGLLARALLTASGLLHDRQPDPVVDGAEAPRDAASEGILLRLEERAEELRREISKYDTDPLGELIERVKDATAFAERRQLIERIAHDAEAARAVEQALEKATSRAASATYQAILFEGTRESRWLDALLASARQDPPTDEGDSYWDTLNLVLSNDNLDHVSALRILEFLSTCSTDEVGTAIVEYDCVGCFGVERFESARAYYGLIQRVRDYALADDYSGRRPLGALAAFSGEAYVVAMAKLLSDEDVKLPERIEVIEDHRARSDALAQWKPELAASLPTGVTAEEWQRWLAENPLLVSTWMAPDLSKVHD